MRPRHDPSRVLELLADHALDGLEQSDREELESLLGEPIREDAVTPMEVTASALTLAMLTPRDLLAMPASLEQRLADSAKRWCEAAHDAAPEPARENAPTARAQPASNGARPALRPSMNGRTDAVRSHPRRDDSGARDLPARDFGRDAGRADRTAPSRSRRLPWLLVAASLALAGVGWMQALRGQGAGVLAPAPGVPSPQELVARSGDAFTVAFADWDNPEVKGVQGEVTWSDAAQAGVMRFTHLPIRTGDRYQLWIVDSRGMEQRISGGVFNGGDCSQSSLEVPIKPGIEVVSAAAFAITIERPEGVWVSDMKRRVVIAKKG